MDHAQRRPQAPLPKIAYRNEAFLGGDEGRPIRILAEYLAPLATFRGLKVHDTVVFFGSARQGEQGPFASCYADARALARRITEWARSLPGEDERFLVCTGGGPGLMEAANRGAAEAGGRTIGLNIGLPFEQRPNPWITPELNFEFHYFFMRKLWFAHLARAMVVFPGGFGTLDELFEFLTLAQTRKLSRPMPVLLYGSGFWKEILDFEALARHGMISREDLGLFRYVDTVDEAFEHLARSLPAEPEPARPAFASSENVDSADGNGKGGGPPADG